MRTLPIAAALLALLLAPTALAQAPPAQGMDIVITVPAQGEPTQVGPTGLVTFQNMTAGQRYVWSVDHARERLSIEFRVHGAFKGVLVEQVIPRWQLDAGERTCIDVRARGACDDDTFVPYPNERVWEGGQIVRGYHRTGDLADFVMRINIPGPANGTLVLTTDTTAPNVTAGQPTMVNHYGFQLETRTDELAIVDVQIRKPGAAEWIENPTPDPNLLQRFPIQGLDADTEYEYRIIATDWAQNKATLGPFKIRSAPAPVLPKPVVTPISPHPNMTVPQGSFVVVQARVESPESPVPASLITVFFDKRAITEGVQFDGNVVTYTPQSALAVGPHSIAVEATNEAGGKGVARWSFTIEAPQGAPGPGLLWIGAAIAGLAWARRLTSKN